MEYQSTKTAVCQIVPSTLAFYSENPSSNPGEVYSITYYAKLFEKSKRGHFKVHLSDNFSVALNRSTLIDFRDLPNLLKRVFAINFEITFQNQEPMS